MTGPSSRSSCERRVALGRHECSTLPVERSADLHLALSDLLVRRDDTNQVGRAVQCGPTASRRRPRWEAKVARGHGGEARESEEESEGSHGRPLSLVTLPRKHWALKRRSSGARVTGQLGGVAGTSADVSSSAATTTR